MKKKAFLIMAVSIGSRFETSVKQLEPVGLYDEIADGVYREKLYSDL